WPRASAKITASLLPSRFDRRAGRATGLTPFRFLFRARRFRGLLRRILRAGLLRVLRSRSCAQTEHRRMSWLVEADLQTAGKFDGGHLSPACGSDAARKARAVLRKLCHRLLDVVAHEVEVVGAVFVGGMDPHLGRRQGE